MDYSSYMETIIFRTAAILGFRRLQSYMLPCLYALLSRFIRKYSALNIHITINSVHTLLSVAACRIIQFVPSLPAACTELIISSRSVSFLCAVAGDMITFESFLQV